MNTSNFKNMVKSILGVATVLLLAILLNAFTEKAKTEAAQKKYTPAQLEEEYIWFNGTDENDCDQIDLTMYPDFGTPPVPITLDEVPTGCDGEDDCCGKAYPKDDVQYNFDDNRWEPVDDNRALYFRHN